MTNKVVVIVGSGIVALLVALLIVGIVLLNTINDQAERAEWEKCMARYGFAADAPVPRGMSDDQAMEYFEALADAGDACDK